MCHRLIGMYAAVRLDVEVQTGVELLRHDGRHLACLSENLAGPGVLHVYARNDENVAFGHRTDGLQDQKVVIPGLAVMNFGDCILFVLDDGAIDTRSVLKGNNFFLEIGHFSWIFSDSARKL